MGLNEVKLTWEHFSGFIQRNFMSNHSKVEMMRLSHIRTDDDGANYLVIVHADMAKQDEFLQVRLEKGSYVQRDQG